MESSDETLGALDLGGGSTQIVFKPTSKVNVVWNVLRTRN